MENTPKSPQSESEETTNPGTQSQGSTPQFEQFGTPNEAGTSASSHASNDGSNDNPDEFSEFRHKHPNKTEDYGQVSAQADPTEQRGHVEQNQHPEAIAAVQDSDESTRRAAYALDDPRYKSGGSSTWTEDKPA